MVRRPHPACAVWVVGALAVGAGCSRAPRTDTPHVGHDGASAPRGGGGGRPASAEAEVGVSSEVRVAAGAFLRGRDGSDRPDEGPPHRVRLHAYRIDATLVTRGEFARFVKETAYVTSAERMGYGVGAREGMDDWAWERVPHASWRRPFHQDWPETEAFLRDDAPVVMVSHSDATAYCAHVGKRLPTEAEWEYAMRAGHERTRFPWGDEPERARPDGGVGLGLNFWQGASHHKNDRRDGYLYVSPVRAFAPNAWGVFDPVGNVWQWTADWYDAHAYRELARSGDEVVDPKGPSTGTTRVLRGGSWWCGVCTCEGYGLFYRGKASPEAPFNNNGFRCARDD
ncbi:MAG: SUMF1/EgtB/PvdO family nonheme iron enzyme [Polyangiaceae bacterium]